MKFPKLVEYLLPVLNIISEPQVLDYTPHGDQNGCVEVTYNFMAHKGTKFGNFMVFKTSISCFNRVPHICNTKIRMK